MNVETSPGWMVFANNPHPDEVTRQYAPGECVRQRLRIPRTRVSAAPSVARRTRLVIVLLSVNGWPPTDIAALLHFDPKTVRRWIHRHAAEGMAGLPDRPRS